MLVARQQCAPTCSLTPALLPHQQLCVTAQSLRMTASGGNLCCRYWKLPNDWDVFPGLCSDGQARPGLGVLKPRQQVMLCRCSWSHGFGTLPNSNDAWNSFLKSSYISIMIMARVCKGQRHELNCCCLCKCCSTEGSQAQMTTLDTGNPCCGSVVHGQF